MRYTIQKLQSLPWHIYSRLDNVSFNPYISELICTFWTAFVLFNTSLKNTRLSDFVKPGVLFLTTLVLSWIDPLYTNFYSVPSVCHRGMEVLLKRGIIRTIGVIAIIWIERRWFAALSFIYDPYYTIKLVKCFGEWRPQLIVSWFQSVISVLLEYTARKYYSCAKSDWN